MTPLKRRQGATQQDLKPGEYTQVSSKALHGDITWCHLKCPKCSVYTRIAKRHHSINYLGELYPMVTCPKECGFCDWVCLEDWMPEAMGTA